MNEVNAILIGAISISIGLFYVAMEIKELRRAMNRNHREAIEL